MKTDENINTAYSIVVCLNHSDENRWFSFWALISFAMVYTMVEILFSMRIKVLLLRIDQGSENIELMFPNENVFRLLYGSVCLATTEGTCSGA